MTCGYSCLTQRIAEIDEDYMESTTDGRIIIISKYDEAENWTAFICKRIDGNILCGGHMGLGQSISDLLEWMDEMENYGIKVVVDGSWFGCRKNVKKHPITIICEWLSSTIELIKQDQLYYFIIDTNTEKVINLVQDNAFGEVLDTLNRSEAEEYVHSVLGSIYEQVSMSNSRLSDKIAYPFIFHGMSEQKQFVYDWYFFWFNLTNNLNSDFSFAEINDFVHSI